MMLNDCLQSRIRNVKKFADLLFHVWPYFGEPDARP
jgi:hypothetical protein